LTMGSTSFLYQRYHRTVLITLGLLVSIILVGCERPLDRAFGDRKEIVIFADEANWNLYGDQLKGIFEREVKTPRSELIFRVRHETLDKWQFFSRYYHLLLCGAINEDTPTALRIRELLSDEVEQRIIDEKQGRTIVTRDPYASGQILVIITADTVDRLSDYLQGASEHIFSQMDEHLDELISKLIYREDEQYALEDSLLTDYDFTLRVPWGFRMNTDFEDENFIRMIKYNLERWFYAYWIPDEEIDDQGFAWVRALEGLGGQIDRNEEIDLTMIDFMGQQAMALRDYICRLYYDGDQVTRDQTAATLVEFQGRWAMRLYGLWGNTEKLAGGPFVSYCFYDSDTRRLWWLDGAVFAPNQPKETQLRQMDVMLHTFLTGDQATAYINATKEQIGARR
ncbi:DUF4837 family protein, partial [Gemmatimonadota bacterium]